ncbi:Cna B-type domain-containing protein [Paenibacillus sp. KN14-4R]|uniref:Cna B-type domain-containing protein n=1 Tax=Paenibacillus sp. KN14-4R TaxID=3445773 RepID=UPI003FA092B2
MSRQSKRVFSMFLTIMIFMFTIGQSLVPVIANAQELNTTGLVDSFMIDKTKLNYGEQTQITVNFSDKSGNKMKAGDTLTLTLPPELQGFSGTFPLENGKGDNFGTCQVTKTNVVCTFSDTVEKLQNIRGFFYFKVMGSYIPAGETKTIETDLGTTLVKQSVTIVGPTSGGTSTNFFSKAGDILPNNTNEVRWVLYVNDGKKYLNKDIKISDRIQEGQTLQKNSFSVAVNGKYISLNEYGKYGVRIDITSDTSFDVVINKAKGSGYSYIINYKTDITASGKKQDFFKNNYTVDYQILYEDSVSDSGDAQVKNIDMGGAADGDLPPKGTLRIVKHIEGNKDKFIPDVSFKLYKESGEQIGGIHTTGEQGIVEVPDLVVGNYYVQEISAPDYLNFDPDKKISFKIDANAEKGVKLMIPNKVKTMSVSGTKTWNDNNASDRPDTIKVDLLQKGQVIQTQDVTAASGWNYTFADVPAYDVDGNAYTYTVKEQPVAGYTSEVNGYNITNTKVAQTTTVEGTKTWKDDNVADRPVSIKVDLLQNGQVIQTQDVTAANGWKYTFANLAVNDAEGKAYTYAVKEQQVEGYTSKVNGYDITNTKVAQTTTVEGTKTWKDDNVADRPVSIKVDLLQNGQVIQTQDVTAANGWKYTFANLAVNDAVGKAFTYSVKEQPVAGYKSEVHGHDITNTKIKDPGITPTDPGTTPTDPGTTPTDPGTTPTDPGTTPTEPGTTPTNPGTKPTEPVNPLPPVPGGLTKVEGTKTWNDDNAADRPSMIQVDLLQNDKVIKTQKVTAENGWKYTFADLATYDKDGEAYTYTVKEHPVAGYKSEVHGYDITNTKIKDSKPTDTKTNDSTSNKGDDNSVSLLPKTGESSAGMIFKLVGILLCIFGIILFVRPRAQK